MRKVKWARLLGVVMTVLTVWLCFAPAGAVFAADGADKKTTPKSLAHLTFLMFK